MFLAGEAFMKIKTVSMIGFKSFMDKFEVHLPKGISAIVGPNGCGKSNMVDAIRWALGEQSAKRLRGRQMEDVIFSGADNHKPLGMAEVSISFENGDGSFPHEFAHASEISITRRLYRSGESEYLINSVPCRLKDIQDIFMDTGLGNRAYSIIGQGMISTIVEQKPDDTRAMLEEAAGITKYKKKVDESKRKIELTRGNLTRVEDVLVEVQRQMRSLKYQASKARSFKRISEEIRQMELKLNANAYHELKEESGSKKQSMEKLSQEELALSTDFSRNQAGIVTMKIGLDEKDGEIDTLRQTYLRLKENVNKKESTLEALAAEKRMHLELENRQRKEKEDLGRRLAELLEEKSSIQGKIEKLKQASVHLNEEMTLIEKRVKGRREQLTEAKEGYEEARERLNSGVSREMSLTQESGYLNKRIGEITDSRSRLEKEKEDASLKIKDLTEVSKRKTQVREALAQKLSDIERDIKEALEKRDKLVNTKKRVEEDLRSAEAGLNIHESRLNSLQSLTENFEGYKVGVRTIMKAKDLDARREGRIMGLVAEMIQVEPQYEQAIEAVLADKLQYIIVERQQDGKDAVDYLKVRAKGRSSFIPLKDINGNGFNNTHKGFPLLRDLVSASEPYRPLIHHLLGNAVLVDNLDQAISLWAGNGKDTCLVTLEGDVVDQTGVISGGKLAHHSHGLLARKREIKELKDRVIECRENVVALTTKLKDTDDEFESQKTSLDNLEEEKWDSQEKLNNHDKAIFQLSHELDQLEKLSCRISDDLEHKSREQNGHKEALDRLESDLAQSKERRKREKEYMLQKEIELQETEKEFEQFRSEQEKLKMDYGLSIEEEKGLVREVERIDSFAQDAQQTFKRIEEDIIGAREMVQKTLAKKETLQKDLEGLYVELQGAEEVVNRADQDRNEFRNRMQEEEKTSEILRGELEALKEKIHMANMEQSEISFKMNGLVDTAKEKFSLELSEVYKSHLDEEFSSSELKEKLEHQKNFKERLGEVNLTAIQEHEALKERHDFITAQREDLLQSMESLTQAIRKINKTSQEKFMETFLAVDKKLKQVFPILFSGGTAGLKLQDETRPLESGVLVQVQPPGKNLSHMGLLSGGEKALVAMALLFAIYLIKPSPFCLLDEVDAPLDEANVDRFNDLLKEIKKSSQIILVTHNKRSMEIVDRLYGVTMEKQGVSKLVSVDLRGFEKN
jgi:chromosome segregation protein